MVGEPVPPLPGDADGPLDRLESLSYMDILKAQFIPSSTATAPGPDFKTREIEVTDRKLEIQHEERAGP